MTARDLRRWAERVEADVRAGASLVELIEDVADDLAGAFDLCPQCMTRPVRSETSQGQRGVCATCWLRHLSERQREKLAEIEAQRDYDGLKQRVHRERVAQGLPLPRGPKPLSEYPQVNLVTTGIPIGAVIHECEACGFTWPAVRDVEDVCPECQERRERRHGDGQSTS
ncbi:MAG: hypothetical protein U1E29_17625 [Coriobacteriia bacterium]|nr:hypothetical protein [Coriobacteriia bacterium]